MTEYKDYVQALASALGGVTVNASGQAVTVDDGLRGLRVSARRAALGDGKLIFVGNGGSAAISSHMSIDFAKNGGAYAIALNDSVALSCLANDVGVERMFSEQIAMCANERDTLIAISSSGSSRNIISAVHAARGRKLYVITLTGFNRGNSVNSLGDLNFHVPSHVYGIVESAHQIILHSALDMGMGWAKSLPTRQPTGLLRDDPLPG